MPAVYANPDIWALTLITYQKNHLLVNEKKDVGMAKHYGNKGWAFDYPVAIPNLK